MTDIFVKSFTHLKGRHRAENALRLLQKTASLVKPIMRKRGWVLPVLAEFFPDQPNLLGLNINMGETILLRLRPHFDPDAFLPEEDIVHTMLHELTHFVYGPHDDSFYKYLAGLENEYEDLKRSGYAGEGFHSRGIRVGVGTSHNLPPHLGRLKALEAAERRRREGGSGGGRRLGGGTTRQVGTLGGKKPLSPRELALMAAERRKRDNTACGSGVDARREAEKAAKEGVESKAIDLTLDSDEEIQLMETVSSMVGAGPSRLTTQSSGSEPRPRTIVKPSAQTTEGFDSAEDRRLRTYNSQITKGVRPDPSALPWTCETCTLINEPLALSCSACLSPPPQGPMDGWVCLKCGKQMQHEFWMCSLCGSIKVES